MERDAQILRTRERERMRAWTPVCLVRICLSICLSCACYLASHLLFRPVYYGLYLSIHLAVYVAHAAVYLSFSLSLSVNRALSVCVLFHPVELCCQQARGYLRVSLRLVGVVCH